MPPRPSLRFFRPFVCPECQIRSQIRLISNSARLAASSPSSHSPRYTRLKNRSIIRLDGLDAADFLQGLVPAKLFGRSHGIIGAPVYTVFLTAQGRVSHDVFLYPPGRAEHRGDAWLIEVDSEVAGELVKHLRKHKLRSKFVMERVPQEMLAVYYLWPSNMERQASEEGENIGGPDPRPGMGSRWLLGPDGASKSLEEIVGERPEEMPLQDYTIHRMLNGIAEGQEEIIPLSALPQESNVDFFEGIDFNKGCYLGQELTIRTHHTGVVRKRILPCQLYDSTHPLNPEQETPIYNPDSGLQLPPPGSNIAKLASSSKRSTGKWLGGVGNIGLALCRLEMMTDLSVSADPSTFDPNAEFRVKAAEGSTEEHLVRAFVPPWLRASIEESKSRRAKKKPRDDDDGEDAID